MKILSQRLQVDSCVETKTGGILEEGKDAIVGPAVDAKEDKLLVGTDVGPKLGEGGCIEGSWAGCHTSRSFRLS